jgi:hypothetical protein
MAILQLAEYENNKDEGMSVYTLNCSIMLIYI